jgi:glycosyltransferase involved in cell wall biosynthesis
MKNKISIIVPVYNVEAYLDECINSLVNQTYTNLEIILVDDGSPDRCPQMCDFWAHKDSRVKVIHQKNGGLSSARNAGLEIAEGDYIGFVDSDDYIAPDMYQVMVRALEGSTKKIACCSPYIVTEQGELIWEGKYPSRKEMDVEQALDEVFLMRAEVSVWSKLYNRAIFEDIRFPVGETNEDFPLLIPTIAKANGMVHVQRCLYYYRQRVGSITKQPLPSEKNFHLVYKNLRKIEEQLCDYKLEKIRNFAFFSAQHAYWSGLICEKKYEYLSDKLKKDYGVYRSIMWKYSVVYLTSRNSSFKDKILYALVLTKLLRPMYRLICPKRL